MQWFLERISVKSLPVTFGKKEKEEHPDDFSVLIKKGVLKRGANLDTVFCELCEEGHECQVREQEGQLFYVCENGSGKKVLSDDDLVTYEYENDAFMELLADDFGIKKDKSFSDEGAYVKDVLYRLGVFENKNSKVEVYYLRTEDAGEPASLFEQLESPRKILITNTKKPTLVYGKSGVHYCVLAESLSSGKKSIFDVKQFEKSLENARRVSFNKKEGHLYLDDKRIYTAGLESPEYYFLLCLWERWEQQVSHNEIRDFAKSVLGRDTADTAQKFCNKMKSNIKKDCPKIDQIITIPTTGHYMMADPIAGEKREKKEK